jgi:hypothetical protein
VDNRQKTAVAHLSTAPTTTTAAVAERFFRQAGISRIGKQDRATGTTEPTDDEVGSFSVMTASGRLPASGLKFDDEVGSICMMTNRQFPIQLPLE